MYYYYYFIFTEKSDSSFFENYENGTDDLPSNALQPAPQTSRKRVRRMNTWKQVKAKKLRNEGKAYVDRKGKIHKNKQLVEYNHQCRYKCNTNIPEDI